MPGHRFVVYLQDHDQVGNRATGDRISATLSDGLLKVGAALVLTSAYTPMLWMGEEWGARTPWQFFSDHEGDLGEAVRQGRRAEFASHGWATEDVPDPQAEQTLRDSTLDWSELEQERHVALLTWTRDLIALRRARPELSDGRRDRVEVAYDEDARWLVVRRGAIAVLCNLSDGALTVPLSGAGTVLLASERGSVQDGKAELAPESVLVVELSA
jgi:maltooligosyltrehalose trehalohydrolase